MTAPRDIYRDRKGRFTTRAALWQGPVLPYGHPVLIERERTMWQRLRQRFMDCVTAPSPILQHLRDRGRA